MQTASQLGRGGERAVGVSCAACNWQSPRHPGSAHDPHTHEGGCRLPAPSGSREQNLCPNRPFLQQTPGPAACRCKSVRRRGRASSELSDKRRLYCLGSGRTSTFLNASLSQHFLVLLSLWAPSLDPRAAGAPGCLPGLDNAGTVLQSHLIFLSCHISASGRHRSLEKETQPCLHGSPSVRQMAPAPNVCDGSSISPVKSAGRRPACLETAPGILHPPFLYMQFQFQDHQRSPDPKRRPRPELPKAHKNPWALALSQMLALRKSRAFWPLSAPPARSFLPLVL